MKNRNNIGELRLILSQYFDSLLQVASKKIGLEVFMDSRQLLQFIRRPCQHIEEGEALIPVQLLIANVSKQGIALPHAFLMEKLE